MKKILLSVVMVCMALFANAQWVNDPAANTLVHTGQSEYQEIYQSRCPNGDFYIQFNNSGGGDWSPKMMHVSKDGVPMWDEPVYFGQSGSSMSTGVSMCATTDNCAVSHFSSDAIESGVFAPYAAKVDASGEIVWGPIATATLPESVGLCRTEIVADENGGVWAGTTDFENNIYVSHINAAGTIVSSVQIPLGELGGVHKMVASNDGGVLVAYQSYDAAQGWTMYDETIKVTKINAAGSIVDTKTMMNTTTIQSWKFMDIIPDGMGGGWCWIEHCGGAVDAFNLYVMHFSAEGNCTTYTNHPFGVQICPTDAAYYRLQGSGTYDVLTGDLILVFRETDAGYQSNNSMRVARITPSGEIVNGEGGTVIVPTSQVNIGQFRVACAPDRTITIIYSYAEGINDGYMKCLGTDSDFSILWAHDFNTNQCVPEYKEAAEGAYEYADGQYVLFFQDDRGGVKGLYGQNIQKDGTMGPVIENPCAAPTDLTGVPYQNGGEYGAYITWTPATGDELSFNVYRGVSTTSVELIGNVTGSQYIDDLTGEEGGFVYVVKAVCEEGESDPATTPQGIGYVIVNVEPTAGCDAPTNLAGEYVYNENGTFGANITWSSTDADSYNVYKGLNTSDFELAGNVTTNEFTDLTEINTYYYMVKAVCDGEESDPATTASGDPYIEVVVTDVNENMEAEISVYQNGNNIIINGVNFENVDIYNVSGQVVKHVGSNSNVIDASDLNAGMYFVNVKANGRVISTKVVIR